MALKPVITARGNNADIWYSDDNDIYLYGGPPPTIPDHVEIDLTGPGFTDLAAGQYIIAFGLDARTVTVVGPPDVMKTGVRNQDGDTIAFDWTAGSGINAAVWQYNGTDTLYKFYAVDAFGDLAPTLASPLWVVVYAVDLRDYESVFDTWATDTSGGQAISDLNPRTPTYPFPGGDLLFDEGTHAGPFGADTFELIVGQFYADIQTPDFPDQGQRMAYVTSNGFLPGVAAPPTGTPNVAGGPAFEGIRAYGQPYLSTTFVLAWSTAALLAADPREYIPSGDDAPGLVGFDIAGVDLLLGDYSEVVAGATAHTGYAISFRRVIPTFTGQPEDTTPSSDSYAIEPRRKRVQVKELPYQVTSAMVGGPALKRER